MWVKCKILKIIKWNNNTFSIIFNAKINKFIPGQFAIIKFFINKIKIQRFYSYINYYNKKNILEFYISKINNGIASNYIFNIKNIFYIKKSFGNFTIEKIKNLEYYEWYQVEHL